MKHVKTYQIFEESKSPLQKLYDLTQKGRDLDKKKADLKSKAAEKAVAQRNEEDPIKSEILASEVQKLSLQAAIIKLDSRITALKIKQEQNKK